MKRVLCLTDFSDCSLNAIQYAIALLKHEACEFYILNVQSSRAFTMDDLMAAPMSSSVYDSVIADNKKNVEQLIVKLQNDYCNEKVNFEGIVDYDVFIDSINQVIASKSIDLVVMGTNGASNIREVIFGSNAVNVMRHIKCNTLMVPQLYNYKTIDDVLILHLDDQEVDFKMLNSVFNVDTLTSTNKHLCKVYDTNKASNLIADMDEIEERYNAEGYNYREIKDVPLDHFINAYVQTNKADLITVIANKQEMVSRTFIRYIKHIKEANQRPILIAYN